MPELTKGQITKALKRYGVIFAPKYRAFNILENKIDVVVQKSTQIWKLIYGLTIVKQGEVDPSERNQEDKDQEKNDDKNDDKEDDAMEEDERDDNIIGEEPEKQDDDKAIAKQQQDEQSV